MRTASSTSPVLGASFPLTVTVKAFTYLLKILLPLLPLPYPQLHLPRCQVSIHQFQFFFCVLYMSRTLSNRLFPSFLDWRLSMLTQNFSCPLFYKLQFYSQDLRFQQRRGPWELLSLSRPCFLCIVDFHVPHNSKTIKGLSESSHTEAWQ